MEKAADVGTAPKRVKRWKTARPLGRSSSASRVLLALLIALMPHASKEQVAASHPRNDSQLSTPEPALPAILKLFETFEVVGMPAAHGEKDVDDFILSLIRDRAFRDQSTTSSLNVGMCDISRSLIATSPARTYRSPRFSMSGETRLNPCVANPASSSNCIHLFAHSINAFLPHDA